MSSSRAPSNHGMRLLHPQPAREHPVGAVDDERREPQPQRRCTTSPSMAASTISRARTAPLAV